MVKMTDLPTKGGFSFDLCRRNEMLLKNGVQMPPFRKTGTTIVGLVFQMPPFCPLKQHLQLDQYDFSIISPRAATSL